MGLYAWGIKIGLLKHLTYYINKDRTELDLNPTYTLEHNPDILQYKECLEARFRNK